MKKVVITGAAGNIGGKLTVWLRGRYELILLDKHTSAGAPIVAADLEDDSATWGREFAGAAAVVHLAANSTAQAAWPDLIGPNIDATINVFEAAVGAGVPRVVFASTNHVMGGYMDQLGPGELTTALPPRPGARYTVAGEDRDSTPYASTKLFGERLGRSYTRRYGLTVLSARIGWNKPGANRWQDIPPERGAWFRQMWISNRDCCELFRLSIEADIPTGFEVVNGMSANAGMPWDMEHARRVLGFRPADGIPAGER